MSMKSINYTEGFRQYVFDTVVKHIRPYLQKKDTPVTFNSYFEGNLDMSIFDISFFIDDLEKITLLDLDATFDSIPTVGDVCKLIEQRLKTQKQALAQKINKIPLNIKSIEIMKVKTNEQTR